VLCEYAFKRAKYFPFHGKALKATRSLKEIKSGRCGLVIANGPSARNLDLGYVAAQRATGLDVICINYFPLSEASQVLTPDYLVLSDPYMRPSQHADSRNHALWTEICRHNYKVVVPTSWYPEMAAQQNLSGRVVYFNDIGLEGWTRNISPLRARGYLPLTAYKALAFADFMGFDKIFIIGFDNSMFKTIHVTDDNRLVQFANHFFAQGGVEKDITHHFPNGIADYFYDVSLCFATLSRCFRSDKIFNLDPESLVDSFTKISQSPLIAGGENES
jgi:hypothetical protein